MFSSFLKCLLIFCEFLNIAKFAPFWFTTEFRKNGVELGLWRQPGKPFLTVKRKRKCVYMLFQECQTVLLQIAGTLQIQKEAFSCTWYLFMAIARPEAIKQRKKGIDFLRTKRTDWKPLSILQCVLNTSSQVTTSLSLPFYQKWAANPQMSWSRLVSDKLFIGESLFTIFASLA